MVLEAVSIFAKVLRQLTEFWLLGDVAAVPVESRVEWRGCLTYVYDVMAGALRAA